ncbi:MAG: orotate phosphoribosyltransferase [bacterium]|nr:orotate phosphoribosyltransferase [bacterium]
MDIPKLIAKDLLKTEAVKISIHPPFTWASGIKSPIYCDNRVLISHPGVRETIVNEMVIKIQKMKPDVIAGTATAGIPWAAFVAFQMKLPMVYVRPEPKDHGAGKQIEGFLPPGEKVVLVEDLISTGGSSLKAVKALREEGQAVVQDIVAIVTYEMEKSRTSFDEANITATTLTDFSHLIEEVKEQGYIPQDQLEMVREFTTDPANWWDRFQKERR